jgi:hypothetical protein
VTRLTQETIPLATASPIDRVGAQRIEEEAVTSAHFDLPAGLVP